MVGESKSAVRKVLESDPVLVRGVIVAVFGFVAMILNVTYAEGLVESVTNGVISLLALAAAVWSRGKVTPSVKVVSYLPSPNKRPSYVLPGGASDVSGVYVQPDQPEVDDHV